jgi:hypothetical protein
MSREAIIRQIVARDIANQDLSAHTISSTEAVLYELACEEFGSWQTALEYAGVRSRMSMPIDKELTRKRVRQQLRRLCTTGYDLGSHVNRSRNRLLHDAAIGYFGSWREALAASGINLANVSRRRPKHLDSEMMILWLQQRKAAGLSLRWTVVCLENRDYALAIRRTFRSWREAIAAAEIGGEGETPD